MKPSEEKKLKESLGIKNRRGETFVGYRPTVFVDKRYTKKNTRQYKQNMNIYD